MAVITGFGVLSYAFCQQVTVSVLGQEEGYTVKYNPLPEGVPKGEAQGNSWKQRVYLTVYPESSPNTDMDWRVWFQYFIVKNDIMINTYLYCVLIYDYIPWLIMGEI